MLPWRVELLLLAALPFLAYAADPPPEFSAAGVVRGTQAAPILVPGAGMSIYGSHLGPTPGCAANPDPKLRETVNPRNPDANFANQSVYPKELCGVVVMLGDKPAGLLYVSDKQINFKVPQDSAETGTLNLVVFSQGQSSAPLKMQAGFEKTSISLDQPAYTDLPVWLKVDTRMALGRVAYPSPIGPAGFGCDQVEVRRDGKPLPMLPGSDWMKYGGAFSGPPCGSYAFPAGNRRQGSLPLHLLYRFDSPGIYEVRYTRWSGFPGMPRSEVRAQSEWTAIEILPSAPNQREDWLDLVRKGQSTDAAEIVTDILPSVLGFPDVASFDIVTSYLYHPFPAVRRYAAHGLSYWPEDSTSAKLLALLHTKGPNDELVRFLLQQPEFGPAHHAEIVAACLPYLESDSPVAIDGALTALQWPPAAEPAVFEAMLRAAEDIVPRADAQTRNNLLQALAGPTSAPRNDPRVHVLLRKFLDQGYDVAAQPLLSFRDPDDLPRLGGVLAAVKADPLPYRPELLYQAFGSAAVPYLETALRASPGRFSERDIALQLMAAGDSVGFQYALRVIAPKGGTRLDMIQSLKRQFPELKGADDDAITVFVKARTGN
jgi:hypothetical protein